MAFSVARLKSSGMPGKPKSTILSGHKDSHFAYLKKLKLGDEIITQDKHNFHSYKVTSINIINSNVEKLHIRNTNELILTTCYPFSDFQFGGPLRFVVVASPIKSYI
jgi:sortase A